MGDVAIGAVIYPKKPKADASKAEIDHAHVDGEMRRAGVVTPALWSEHCEAVLASGKEPHMCSAFCRKHCDWIRANKAAVRIERKPAQGMQVDHVGGHGCPRPGHGGDPQGLRVRRMPAVFRRALRGRVLRREGGVLGRGPRPRLLVLRRQRADGCAGQPQAGSDQEHGRRASGQRAVPAHGRALRLRNQIFTSLAQLNGSLLEKVREINARPFQKREGSRDEVFIRQEKPLLVPLPGKPYEMAARKAATVNFNHHAAFGGLLTIHILMAFCLSSNMIDLLGFRRFVPLAFRLVARLTLGLRRAHKGGKRRRIWKTSRPPVFSKKFRRPWKMRSPG
ncbi:hypothetical protein [Slackia exigua]|uniref:hypothetical protein n=1 Tax=Slackia exigua TaxID=84109 RepID=UPI0028D1BAA7|nr:hypothetical protein [Slackia exigua]